MLGRSPNALDLEIYSANLKTEYHWEGLRQVELAGSDGSTASLVAADDLKNDQHPTADGIPTFAAKNEVPLPQAKGSITRRLHDASIGSKIQQTITQFLTTTNGQVLVGPGNSKRALRQSSSTQVRSPKRRKKPAQSGRPWSGEEVERARRYRAQGRTYNAIGHLLGRTAAATQKKINREVRSERAAQASSEDAADNISDSDSDEYPDNDSEGP
ncbi:MAG: hypothetical protein L6R39_001675 [Caloplaca ligustica]|nr:MAG: hypothetical protein L6R39_001675 [Caloplaca ligustica]